MHTVENVTNDNKGLRDFRNFSANISSKKVACFMNRDHETLSKGVFVEHSTTYINVQAKLRQIT